MDNMVTLASLVSLFDERLQAMDNMLNLTESKEEDWFTTYLSKIFGQLAAAEVTMAEVKKCLKDSQEALKNTHGLKEKLKDAIESAIHMNENLPDHIDCQKPEIKETLKNDSVDPDPAAVVNDSQHKSTEKAGHKRKAESEKEVKYFEYLTVAEFDAIPKYMKGRIAYKQVNNTIKELTKCFEAKYQLMSLKKKAVPEKKKPTYDMYKAQENKETQGIYFIVDNDMKEYSSLRTDPTTRSIFVMLRHTGRLREIRGGGLLRYAATFY
ncbi:spindle and kinetochore-associated protein 1-like [Argonauta hians]